MDAPPEITRKRRDGMNMGTIPGLAEIAEDDTVEVEGLNDQYNGEDGQDYMQVSDEEDNLADQWQ